MLLSAHPNHTEEPMPQALTSEIKIETGLPMPGLSGARTPLGVAVAKLASAKIGDSFFLAGISRKESTRVARLAITRFGKGRLAQRKVDGGSRFWKIAEPTKGLGKLRAAA